MNYDEMSREELLEVINALTRNEGDFTEPIEVELREKIPTIISIEEKSVGCASQNLLIEGDNLHSLTLLQESHRGKIGVIIADPPYSTENPSLAYTDKFKKQGDDDDHSRWISFMEKRLKLAYPLLKEDGVFFIHIDDKELPNLRILCNSIFGERNYIQTLIWEKKYTMGNDTKTIASQTEYILLYGKNVDLVRFNKRPLRPEYVEKVYRNPDNDPRGAWRTSQLFKDKNRKSFPVVSPTGRRWVRNWNYNEAGMKRLIADDMIWWGKDGNSCPSKKIFLKDNQGMCYGNLLRGSEVGYTATGTNEIYEILHSKTIFPYAKPVALIEELIQMVGQDDSIVLDFFAGSGTTGHAVLDLNKETGANRTFILCTNNENNICEKVTARRLKRVIEGYDTPKFEYRAGTGGDFQYMRCEFE